MKRMIIALVAMFMMTFTTASAMSYEQARQQALFLTDKMAYELNLTEDQYEAAYEVNLDYLMSVDTYDDLYGAYWRQRNMDLSYILLDWRYRTYLNATYFYRPLYWNAGYWHFGIYARYPRRDYFYFGCPHFYVSYRGGHSWRVNGNRSWYHGRRFGGPHPGGHPRVGMRDGFNRGDYGRGRSFGNLNRENRPQMNPNRGFGNASRPNNNAGFETAAALRTEASEITTEASATAATGASAIATVALTAVSAAATAALATTVVSETTAVVSETAASEAEEVISSGQPQQHEPFIQQRVWQPWRRIHPSLFYTKQEQWRWKFRTQKIRKEKEL